MDPSPSRRGELSELLHKVLNPNAPELANVYFQPPPNVDLKYPCIVYEREDIQVRSADNGPYTMFDSYQVTFIRQSDPDSPVLRLLMGLPHSSFSRHFATSGLNHDVFVIHH